MGLTEPFLAGYGAAQAVPGPLFTFAAYLGAVSTVGPGGVAGAALALGAIFLPGFLLLVGVLPFWDAVRTRPRVRAAMSGANAAVVGILAAALYTPVFTTAITRTWAPRARGGGLRAADRVQGSGVGGRAGGRRGRDRAEPGVTSGARHLSAS